MWFLGQAAALADSSPKDTTLLQSEQDSIVVRKIQSSLDSVQIYFKISPNADRLGPYMSGYWRS